jgi:AraC-like DNA-binding protein
MSWVSTLSTREVEPRDKLGFWNDLLDSTYPGMVVDPLQQQFDAKLSVWKLGELRMVRPASRPAVISRRHPAGQLGNDGTLVIHLVNSGEVTLEQRGRSARLCEGDLVICAAEEHYRFNAPTTHELMVVEMGRAALEQRISQVDDCIARCISRERPGTRLVHRYMNSLWQEARHDPDGVRGPVYASILLDMLASCLDGGEPSPAVRPDPLFVSVQRIVSERIEDPALSPAAIATELGTPLRTLQAAASRSGSTLTQYIAGQRLHRAARLLLAAPHASITDIAFRCGFSDSSYFSRRFQEFFGMSPRQYRARH